MTLREWLDKEGVAAMNFALANDIAQSTMQKYLSGRRSPSASLALKIERGTDGAVTKESIMWGGDDKEKVL